MKNRVKELRDAKHLTQTGLALKVGSTQQTISKIEREIGVPKLDLALIMADFFNVTLEYLFCLSDDADLCIIVGNALDNAIDGTKDIEGAKKIEISMGVKQGNFLLKVKNTFNPELIKFDNNGKRLRTSKTDKSNHGMGIGLIEETALKYNGLMEITMNENIFCLSVLLYQN